MANDPAFLRWRPKFTRTSATPRTAAAQYRYIFGMDVRSVLATITVLTLVLHRSNFALAPSPTAGTWPTTSRGRGWWRFLEAMPGLHRRRRGGPGRGGRVHGVRPPAAPDRMLATVLFSDIIGSTEQAARLGDRSWRALLEAHHVLLRAELERFGGREVATTGDGFFAAFAGPAQAVSCACAMRDAVRPLGMEIRVGLHTGEVEVVGADLAGIAAHIGARVAAAQPSEVLVSRTVADLVAGSGIEGSTAQGRPRQLAAVRRRHLSHAGVQ
jgi:class 3 adenylate cyclase